MVGSYKSYANDKTVLTVIIFVINDEVSFRVITDYNCTHTVIRPYGYLEGLLDISEAYHIIRISQLVREYGP